MTRQAQHVKRRRKAGKCAREGCQEATDKYRCRKHADEHAARVKAIYWEKREAKARERAA